MNMHADVAVAQPTRLAARCVTIVVLSLSLAGGPMAQSNKSRFRGEPVTLNFVNANIEGVTRVVGAILKRQFLVDPRVKGNITLYSDEPISPREVYLNYLAALRGLGFTVVEVGGLFKVVPEADAKLQTGTVSVNKTTRSGDQILTQIFRLYHERANSLVAVLRPLISPNNTINANPGSNTLVITDYADNLRRIAKIIAAMDTPSASEIEVITLKHAVATDVAALVQKLVVRSKVPGGIPGTNTQTILIDDRSNALIVRAANPARMATVKAIIEKLDQPIKGANATGNIYVVHLKNADAVRLAQVLRGAFGGASSSSSSSSSVASTSKAATPAGANVATTASVKAAASPTAGGFIQADPATNSLIITAPEPQYRRVRAVIDKLDSRRAQVYIESMIVKVDADKAAELGFQWQALLGKEGDNNLLGIGTNLSRGSTSSIITATTDLRSRTIPAVGQGLNVGLAHSFGGEYALAALAQFLETKDDVNILSTPNLMMLDNEEAKIVIGENVPFVTGKFTNTGSNDGSTNPFQTIERKDVGITLRVKPQIGEGGTVRLTIFQENSDVTSAAGEDLTTSKTSIETVVVVDDGHIIVIGGLLKDNYSGGVSKVPLLGDIPLIGNLFRSETRERDKSNLMLFLRPVVLRTQDASSALSVNRYDAIRAQQKRTQPTPSRALSINEVPVLPSLRPPSQPQPQPPPPPPTTSRGGHPSSR